MSTSRTPGRVRTATNPKVDAYIEAMRAWRAELEALRPLLIGAGLQEEFKWYKPCYTYAGANLVIFQPFKELCALLFFKGALLDDPDGALREQGENTRSALASSSARSPRSEWRRGPSPHSFRTPSASHVTG